MHGTRHLKQMLIGGVAILAVLLLAGVPLATAAQWAVLLACPLMMVGMMLMMGKHTGHRGIAETTTATSEPSGPFDADETPRELGRGGGAMR